VRNAQRAGYVTLSSGGVVRLDFQRHTNSPRACFQQRRIAETNEVAVPDSLGHCCDQFGTDAGWLAGREGNAKRAGAAQSLYST